MGKLMGLLGLWLCFHGVEPPLPPSPPVCLLWLAPWRSSLHAWWLKSATRLCYAWAGVDGAAWAIWLCFHGVEPPLPLSPPVSLLWLAPWRSSLHAWWLKSATRLCYAWAGVDGGCLGYMALLPWGLNPLRFPCFGWCHGGRAYMLGG
jgi:hypothetical protein